MQRPGTIHDIEQQIDHLYHLIQNDHYKNTTHGEYSFRADLWELVTLAMQVQKKICSDSKRADY